MVKLSLSLGSKPRQPPSISRDCESVFEHCLHQPTPYIPSLPCCQIARLRFPLVSPVISFSCPSTHTHTHTHPLSPPPPNLPSSSHPRRAKSPPLSLQPRS